jgi:hypothetical protein
MPTNNQEKWEDKFNEKYPVVAEDWQYQMPGGVRQELKSFIRQEICQAKIEALTSARDIVESIGTNEVGDILQVLIEIDQEIKKYETDTPE